jgi:hypothetical protein
MEGVIAAMIGWEESWNTIYTNTVTDIKTTDTNTVTGTDTKDTDTVADSNTVHTKTSDTNTTDTNTTGDGGCDGGNDRLGRELECQRLGGFHTGTESNSCGVGE